MRLLFFAPFSGIWEHAELEARLAVALLQAGHEVTYVTCGGALRRHCVVMASMHVPADADADRREAACQQCRGRARAVRSEFGLSGPELDSALDPQVLLRINAHVDAGAARDLIDLKWHGVPVGRRALFPFLVYKKKDDLDLDEAQWHEYRDQLHQTMVAVSVAQQLLTEFRPDHVVTYSSTYSVVSAFLQVAREAGIGDYFIEASGNLAHRTRRAILGRTGIIEWFAALRAAWPRFEHLPADVSHLKEVGDHLENLFGAVSPWAYSTAVGSDATFVRRELKVPIKAKLLLATLSSHDEWFAAEAAGLALFRPFAFATQLEWLDWLVNYAARNPDWYLVIRVHPREFPNRRERAGLFSSHARKLEARLAKLPSNCYVNWPSQQLSLYDLAKAVDVVLNAWSSAGKEMALLGLPVVEWAPDVLLYPPEPRYCAQTADQYADCIRQALADGWQEGNIVRMFRWCALEYGAASYVTRFGVARGSADTPLIVRALRRFARAWVDARIAHRDPLPADSLRGVQETLVAGLPVLLREVPGEAQAEAGAMAVQIRRLVKALFRDVVSPQPGVNGGFGDDLQQRLLGTAHRLETTATAFMVGRPA